MDGTQLDVAAAEAGMGAAHPDAMPENVNDHETIHMRKEHGLSTATSDHAAEAAEGSRAGNEAESRAENEAEKAELPPLRRKSTQLDENKKGKVALIMTALCLAVFLAALDITIITTALPTISEHFNSSAGYTWIGSAFLLANSASSPTWGQISDIFGRKPVLLIANAVFMLGSLLAAVSNSIGMLIAARAIQGIGAGGLQVLVNICIGDLFSQRRRGAYYGIIGGVWAIASSLGPIIGGAFTEKVSWRWCFYINLPLDAVAFFIILFFLDLKTPRTPLWEGLKAIDWIGIISVVGATLMLLFGLQYGGVTHPWNSAIVLSLIIFGLVTFVLFFLNEWKLAKYPIMPLRIFKYRSNIATLTASWVHGFDFIAVSYYMPLYFQAIRGASPLMSGVYVLPTAVGISIASIATGIFIRKTGLYLPPIRFGFVMMTIGYGLFVNFTADSSWAKLVIFQFIIALGIGPNFQAPLIALQSQISPRDIATGTATFGFVRQLATAMSVVIGQVVFQSFMKKKASTLAAALGPATAARLGGGNAGANTQFIDALPPAQRTVARTAFANSLRPMWVMYLIVAAGGLCATLLIKKKTLTKEHEVMKTGLEAERENAVARKAEEYAKAERKRLSRAGTPGTGVTTDKASEDVPSRPAMPPPQRPLDRDVEKAASQGPLDRDVEKGGQ